MATNLEIFNRNLINYAITHTPKQSLILQKKLAFELLRRVVLKTPVDTGRASGNWQLSIGSPINVEIGKVVNGQWVGPDPNQVGLTVLGRLTKPFLVIWLANNVPYIGALEGGHSKIQAPEGFLDISLKELEYIFS